MSIEQGRLASITVSGNVMDLVDEVEFNPGINTDDITHLQSVATEHDNMLPDPTLTFSGKVDTSDAAQALIITAANSASSQVGHAVVYNDPDQTTTYTFPSTCIVVEYSKSASGKGWDTFTCTIKGNGAVVKA